MARSVFMNEGITRYYFYFHYPMLELDLKKSQFVVKLGSNSLWDLEDPCESPLSLKDNIGENCWGGYILNDTGWLIGSAVGKIDFDIKGRLVGSLDWLIIHREWRGEILRSKGERSLCYPFFSFLLVELNRHCSMVSLLNAIDVIGCYCYVKAALDLGYSIYVEEDTKLEQIDDCLQLSEKELDDTILIKFKSDV